MASYFLQIAYIVQAIIIFVAGVLQLWNPKLPQIFQDALLYGKVRGNRKEWSPVRYLEVPKRWFTYFYLIGMVTNTCYAILVYRAYFLGVTPPESFLNAISFFRSDAHITTSPTCALVIIVLMAMQDTRRLLECVFVSSYSKSTMNVGHFAIGIFLYTTFAFTVLCEVPDLTHKQVIGFTEMSWLSILGVVFCFIGFVGQHLTTSQLAELRKTKTGEVRSDRHYLPRGGLFEYVSCPHYLMEMLIYLGFITVSGWSNFTLWSVVIFVFTNQIIAGLFMHRWYKNTYKSYPKTRKAVIPFIL